MKFSNYKTVNITEIAELERAKKGKGYPPGCTLIALSVTKGQVEYRENSGEVDTRWAVVIPKDGNEPKYIYYSIMQAFPEYLRKWKTGINLQFDNLRYLKVGLHEKAEQQEIVDIMEMTDKKIERERERAEFFRR